MSKADLFEEGHKAESLFKGLLASAPDARVIADQGGRIVFVNTQTESLFGYPHQEWLRQDVEA